MVSERKIENLRNKRDLYFQIVITKMTLCMQLLPDQFPQVHAYLSFFKACLRCIRATQTFQRPERVRNSHGRRNKKRANEKNRDRRHSWHACRARVTRSCHAALAEWLRDYLYAWQVRPLNKMFDA
jgi:hypothetical protein